MERSCWRIRVAAATTVLTLGVSLAPLALGQTPGPPPESSLPALGDVDLSNAPTRGAADAPVTLVMFTDFANPAAGSGAVILQGVLNMYGDRVRVVFKHTLPADRPERLLAHEAARAAAEQGRFWELHELLLANQGRHTRAEILAMAAQLELDVARFTTSLDSGASRAVIERDRLEAEALKIRQQPTWFLNGDRLKGPVTFAELRAKIDPLLR